MNLTLIKAVLLKVQGTLTCIFIRGHKELSRCHNYVLLSNV